MAKKEVRQLIAGLEIGSSAIRMAVGQVNFANSVNNEPELQIMALVQVPSEGVHKGAVTSIEETVSSISNALEQTERAIGVPIEHVWVGIASMQTMFQKSKGVVAVAKADGEIGREDVERAIEAARTIASPLNYEILHVIPQTFAVDGQTGIKDPVGMTGIRLEVDTQIIQAPTAVLKNLTKAVYRTGVDIDDIVLSILSAGEAAVTSRQKDLGVAIVNIGSTTTNLVVYEEGDIIHLAVLPIGSEYLTKDLAVGLRTSIDVAEQVKINYGQCFDRDISKKEIIDLGSLGATNGETASVKYISEIITARMEEILEKIDDELSKIGRSSLLPAGVVFTGGGAKISGLVELAKEKLRLPASLGFPIDITSVTEKINDLSFTSVVGLVKWGLMISAGNVTKVGIGMKGLENVTKQVKSWFKSLIP